MLTHNFTPGFKAKLHQKDLGIVRHLADELVIELPGTMMVSAYINALVEAGMGEEDSSAIVTLFEQKWGKKF